MIVRNVGVLSVGRLLGILYAAMGLLIGGVFSLIALVGASFAGGHEGAFPILFGVGAVVLFPLMYGTMGFVGGVVMAALYNLIAGFVGGIEVDIS